MSFPWELIKNAEISEILIQWCDVESSGILTNPPEGPIKVAHGPSLLSNTAAGLEV